MVTKIGIISTTALLQKTLEFNLSKDFEVATIKNVKNNINDACTSKYDILITDNKVYRKEFQFFDLPINLFEVISYVENEVFSVLGRHSPYVDGKFRTLYYMNYKIPLTEQACNILELLSSSDEMKSDFTLLKEKLGIRHLNFEALKTSLYRVNQQFIKYKIPLKVALERECILLEKL